MPIATTTRDRSPYPYVDPVWWITILSEWGEDFDGSFIRWEEWKLMDQLRDAYLHIAISKGAKLEERELPELTLPTAEGRLLRL